MHSKYFLYLAGAILLAGNLGFGQSINSGTLTGIVTDPSGASPAGAPKVELRNAVTGYQHAVNTAADGTFRFNSVQSNTYQLTVSAAGFAAASQQVEIHGSVPVNVNLTLQLAAENTTVNVEASGATVETDPSAHEDVDRSSFLKLPTFDAGGQLSQAITYSTGGVAADANGFFHPLGDHAQVSFVIDGQPISDQQSKMFSTQMPTNALQSMELISGAPDAQYGDKSSLIVNASTRSGLGASKPFGSIESQWGSFGTWGGSATFGFGGPKYGNFTAVNASRSGHFLDSPELLPIHDIGNNESIVDRIDWQPDGADSFHLNLFVARNWFQIPNSLRSTRPGSEAARAHLEHRAGLPAHVRLARVVDRQPLWAQGSVQLLRQPQSFCGYADYRFSESLPNELRLESGYFLYDRNTRFQARHAGATDPPARKLSVCRNRSDLQSSVPECCRGLPAAAGSDRSGSVFEDQFLVCWESEPAAWNRTL